MQEIRARADEGYSARQLMRSRIPDIGKEMNIAASEVTEALERHEAGLVRFFVGAGVIN